MTTLLTDRNTLLREDGTRALIVTPGAMQGQSLQEQLAKLGWPATVADGSDLALSQIESSRFDLVVLDVDLGYPAVGALVDGLRLRHPDSRVAIMLGWWDSRTEDMRPLCDLVINKPVHPLQLRELVQQLPRYERLEDQPA